MKNEERRMKNDERGRLCVDSAPSLTRIIQSVAQDFGLGLRDGLYRKWLAVKQFLRLMSVAQRFLPP